MFSLMVYSPVTGLYLKVYRQSWAPNSKMTRIKLSPLQGFEPQSFITTGQSSPMSYSDQLVIYNVVLPRVQVTEIWFVPFTKLLNVCRIEAPAAAHSSADWEQPLYKSGNLNTQSKIMRDGQTWVIKDAIHKEVKRCFFKAQPKIQ